MYFDLRNRDRKYIWMGYNFSRLTFGPKGMIIQESVGILPVNALLTHPIAGLAKMTRKKYIVAV